MGDLGCFKGFLFFCRRGGGLGTRFKSISRRLGQPWESRATGAWGFGCRASLPEKVAGQRHSAPAPSLPAVTDAPVEQNLAAEVDSTTEEALIEEASWEVCKVAP